MGEVRCSYENEKFPEEDFDSNGVHIGAKPKHLVTGQLVRDTSDGNTPADAPPVD